MKNISAQSFTSFMADLHQDINTVSSLHLAGGASIEQDEVND